jgi:hypothetical protein
MAATLGYSSASPVRVASCSLEPTIVYGQSGDGEIAYIDQINTNLKITYTDAEPRPIASVTFQVSDGAVTQEIVDSGTFSPGATITHVFSWPYIENTNITCKASFVAFADGSKWARSTVADESAGKE